MASPQTLSESERRTLAVWAAACAARVLPLFHGNAEAESQVREAWGRARTFGVGGSTAAQEIRLRMVAFKAASAAADASGAAAARSVAQAAAVAHMGAHALGAAAYAVKAVTLQPDSSPEAGDEEVRWQLIQLTEQQRDALKRLPLLGTDSSGPLATGLLSRGILGDVIRQIQASVAG